MGRRDLVFLGALVGLATVVTGGALRPGRAPVASPSSASLPTPAAPEVAREVDRTFRASWESQGIQPAPSADELTVMRRLALALTGSIPSIEEIRQFESRPAGGRVGPWLDSILEDRRCSDYLAERLARAYVGTEDGPFLLFRRRRFTTWLSDALHENRPYDSIVRELIAGEGLWTDHPATNFVTAAYSEETQRPDPERLAVKVSRAFLGVRLDCAQCHDHPFADWKQSDFRGLAAFFGATHSNLRGIRDETLDYQPPDRKSSKPTPVDPCVPFRLESLPASGNPRERLANWLVDPGNPNLARATVNRVWALLFGRPLSDPVDDLPPESELPRPLTLLADDFASHGYDLRRLIRAIATTDVFRLESATADGSGPSDEQVAAWASFPLTPVRPEQVAESITQAASIATIGPRSPWVVRFAAFNGRNDFVRRYGDTGEDEFDTPSSTIPQRLLLLNGDLVRDKTGPGMSSASTRIAQLAPDDQAAVELAYLSILTRRPTDEEARYFAERLKGTSGDPRAERLTDLCWTLLNSTEFSWNH